MKQIKEQQAKQKAAEAKQLIKDDKILKAYFAQKHITPLKTASGLYYTIKEEGKGEQAIAGDSVSMNYTGTLLDGTKFDSNTDTAFKHTQPFWFVLGKGAVIKGWDEGVALLKAGSKAILYIPSTMAYGAQARPRSAANPKGIPANSILLFDMELLSSKHPAPPPPAPKPAADTLQPVKTDSLNAEQATPTKN
jgi:FKBP-type peptidyl-prolyl cis-trans isomerase